MTIEDTGIGMNKEDMIQKSGRIAESGTKRFTEESGKEKDAVSLIGQFDVGFYSGCLVANKMEVVSKRNSGTRITLHLKDESDQYLDDIALRAVIEKYSEFCPFSLSNCNDKSRNQNKPLIQMLHRQKIDLCI